MTAKRITINSSREFRSIMKEGIRTNSPHFVLYSGNRSVNSDENARIGIIIAKRNIHLATNRNRIRRLIKETWRKTEYKKNAVLVVKKGINGLKNNEICKKLHYLLHKAVL